MHPVSITVVDNLRVLQNRTKVFSIASKLRSIIAYGTAMKLVRYQLLNKSFVRMISKFTLENEWS